MRKLLVMKLTRMGDIIETAPLVANIRRREPDAEITLVVNESFRDVAALLTGVDRILSFPIFDFAEQLQAGRQDLVDLYCRLEIFADQLSSDSYDLALNITNSQLSGMLMGFVRARETRGLVFDNQGCRQVEGSLIRYFGTNEGIRRYNPFNLSDFLVSLYGAAAHPTRGGVSIPGWAGFEAEHMLAGTEDSPLLGIQLGASEISKRWHHRSFAEVADRILDRTPASIVLIGAEDERPLADAFMHELRGSSRRVVDLVGATSVATLAAVIERMNVLVTGDTGPMHFAAALGVRVINLSLGSAYFRETGPYGEGHWILDPRTNCRPCHFMHACSHMACKRLISPTLVAGIAEALLNDLEPGLSTLEGLDTCDLYRTTFDPWGMLDVVRLTPGELKLDEVLLQIYRIAVSQGELGGDFDSRLAWGLANLGRNGTSLPMEVLDGLIQALKLFNWLEHAAQEGVLDVDRARVALGAARVNEIGPLLERMGARDKQIACFGDQNIDVRFLTRAFILEKEAVRGEDLEALMKGHRRSYVRLDATAAWSRTALKRALRRLVPMISKPSGLPRPHYQERTLCSAAG